MFIPAYEQSCSPKAAPDERLNITLKCLGGGFFCGSVDNAGRTWTLHRLFRVGLQLYAFTTVFIKESTRPKSLSIFYQYQYLQQKYKLIC